VKGLWEALADAGGVAAQHRGSLERVHLCDHATHGEEEYQYRDESQCEPLPGKRTCRLFVLGPPQGNVQAVA